MKRYQVLRELRCDPFTACAIALLNWMRGYPANEIHFMNIAIEYEERTAPPGAASVIGEESHG